MIHTVKVTVEFQYDIDDHNLKDAYQTDSIDDAVEFDRAAMAEDPTLVLSLLEEDRSYMVRAVLLSTPEYWEDPDKVYQAIVDNHPTFAALREALLDPTATEVHRRIVGVRLLREIHPFDLQTSLKIINRILQENR